MNISLSAAGMACISLLVFSSAARAACPEDLPPQLKEDCVVVEGAGATFPNDSYAYRKQYDEWLVKKAASIQPAASGKTGSQGESSVAGK